MARLIDADVLANKIMEIWDRAENKGRTDIANFIANIIVPCIVGTPTIEPKQEWISVKDRLPETRCSNNQYKQTDTVLAFDGCYVMYGYFKIYLYDGYWQFDGIDDDDFEWRGAGPEVTHWMPLPKPPKED